MKDQWESLFKRIVFVEGDITHAAVDAIVNAANPSLLGGGGVDGAIHRAAGPGLLAECRQIWVTTFPAGLPTGEAVMTKGYNLPTRFVIHTVGPIWYGGDRDEPQLLRSCYENILTVASRHRLKTLAVPAISTGAYGYPKEPAARIALATTIDFLRQNEYPAKVIFYLLGDNLIYYQQVLATLKKGYEEI